MNPTLVADRHVEYVLYSVKRKHSRAPGRIAPPVLAGSVTTVASAQASWYKGTDFHLWIKDAIKFLNTRIDYLTNWICPHAVLTWSSCSLQEHALNALCSHWHQCRDVTSDRETRHHLWHLWLITRCNVPVINVWTRGGDEFNIVPWGTGTFHYVSYYCHSLLMA